MGLASDVLEFAVKIFRLSVSSGCSLHNCNNNWHRRLLLGYVPFIKEINLATDILKCGVYGGIVAAAVGGDGHVTFIGNGTGVRLVIFSYSINAVNTDISSYILLWEPSTHRRRCKSDHIAHK